MARVTFSADQTARVNEIIERRLAEERHKHERERARLQASLDQQIAVAVVLSDGLDRLEAENYALRRELSALQTLKRVALFRRQRILSWRGWWFFTTERR